MIETSLGPMDEAALACDTFIFDGPDYYAREHRYRVQGEDQVIAKYHEVLWRKENDFLSDPPLGKIMTSRGEMSLDQLDKKTGTVDNEVEFHCWVEYRPRGEDEVVHRSAHTSLKFAPKQVQAIAGRF